VGKVEYTYSYYSASVGNKLYAGYINKDKVVKRLNAENHIYVTHKLLALIYYVKVAG
jgi:hypothetical protein